MYTISLYTQWFTHNDEWYLYNAQSNFFSRVSEKLVNLLHNRDWTELDESTISYLLSHHIIELKGQEYDYYNFQQMNFNSRNYDSSTLGLVIAPTTACNFNCPYCFEPKKQPKFMDETVIHDLVNFVKLHQKASGISLTWYGGEPLLAFPQIKRILEEFKYDGIPAIQSHTIVTNGSLLTQEMCEFFNAANLGSMQITLDGNKNRHNKTRCFKSDGSPSFDLIYSKLEMIRKLIPSCRINIRVNIDKSCLHDYVEISNLISNDFADDSKINVYPGFIREETTDGRSFHSHCVQTADLIKVNKYFKEHGIKTSIFPERKQRGCMIFTRHSYIIGPEGEIYKCWNDVSTPERVVGHINNPQLNNSSLLTKYMIESSPFRDECKDCNIFPICEGGCGYYHYKNKFHNGLFQMCSPLKEKENLKKALLDGCIRDLISVKD